MDDRFSFQSNPITANHSGGVIEGISKSLDQLFVAYITIIKVLVDSGSIHVARTKTDTWQVVENIL
jgi:hypothetical protein